MRLKLPAVHCASLLAAFVSVVLAAALAGCAALKPTPQQRAQHLDPMLSAAGFQMIPASTAEKSAQLKQLPPLKVNYYAGKDGKLRYWMADPYDCNCILVGDEQAYQKYQDLRLQARLAREQEEATEEQAEAAQEMQMEMMDPFYGPFGPGLVVY
jgi:hypothetical protein